MYFFSSCLSYSKSIYLVLTGGRGGRTVQRDSRTWRSFINGSRKTYSCLDFSGSRKTSSCLNFPAAPRDLPDSSLQAYISHSGGKIRAVLGIRDFQVRLLVNEIRALPNLTVLVVNCWILLLDRLREVVMPTSQEFPGHRKPGHYEPRTAVSRDFPRDAGGPVPVRNTQ